ncbi:hypothetical protein EG329_007055 [Mollisiaceae sp. DMI_Dod_QoI]|nr:hypothetical protein EG329_007055 [Helotiales sp. DMI_Dod_QoI]
MEELDMELCSTPGAHTRTGNSGQRSSCIDLVWASNTFTSSHVETAVSERQAYFSDHLPVTTTFAWSGMAQRVINESKKAWSKLDSKKLTENLAASVGSLSGEIQEVESNIHAKLDEITTKLSQAISTAIEAAVPDARICSHIQTCFTPELKALIKKFHKAERLHTKYHTPTTLRRSKRLKAMAKSSIQKARRSQWRA